MFARKQKIKFYILQRFFLKNNITLFIINIMNEIINILNIYFSFFKNIINSLLKLAIYEMKNFFLNKKHNIILRNFNIYYQF